MPSNISYLSKSEAHGSALSIVLCDWDLNNGRMLRFSPDPYRRLVLALFSTDSCSVFSWGKSEINVHKTLTQFVHHVGNLPGTRRSHLICPK